MKSSTFADDTEKLSNLINIQPGIGSSKCILFHDETLGRWVGVWMNKWLYEGGRVNKWMNEYHQLRIPDWNKKSLLHSDVKKTAQNLQFKCYPKVYHGKTFMGKHSQMHSLFLNRMNFPKTARNRLQSNKVRGQLVSVTGGDIQAPLEGLQTSILPAVETTRCFRRLPGLWKRELERCEHLIDDDLQCVPLASSGHMIPRAGLQDITMLTADF